MKLNAVCLLYYSKNEFKSFCGDNHYCLCVQTLAGQERCNVRMASVSHRAVSVRARAAAQTAVKRAPAVTCGTRPRIRTKIVGGSDAGTGSWPWQVSLQMARYGHVCGATLVGRRWLISAAHCFQDSDAIKGTNMNQWGSQPTNPKNLIHPKYDQFTSDYDIALLELNVPLFFNDLVQPVCIPAPSHSFTTGTSCYVTGWGVVMEDGELASRLQEASVKIISRNMCNKLYDDAVTPRMLCAGNLQGGVDACQVGVLLTVLTVHYPHAVYLSCLKKNKQGYLLITFLCYKVRKAPKH
uniref:Peptidase S1 domain-containing protein n=1 Tax=Neogobius melanostomus TaxID=47308 RepID=A0A8C6TDI2_9GOBI